MADAQVLPTESPPADEDLKTTRPKGLGSSDQGTIAGRNPWKSPYRLWMELLDLVDKTEIEKEHLWWGKAMQPIIIQRYEMKSGRKTRAQSRKRHKSIPYLYAEPDAITLNMKRGPGAVEAKNTNAWGGRDWKLEGLPDMYYLQLQTQTDVFEYEWGTFCVCVGGNDSFWYDVNRDQKTIDLQHKVQEVFWRAVETKEPPPLKGTSPEEYRDLLHAAWPQDDGSVLSIQPESVPTILRVIDSLTTWKAKQKEAEELVAEYKARRTELENRIKATMQNSSTMIVPSYGEITWKTARPTPEIETNTDLLRGQWPEVYAQVCTTTLKSNGRRFYLKPDKDPKERKLTHGNQ